MTDNIDVYGYLYPNKQKEMTDKLENLPQVSRHFWSHKHIFFKDIKNTKVFKTLISLKKMKFG